MQASTGKRQYLRGLYRFGRVVVRAVTRTRAVQHPEYLEDGVVYISRHMDMHGPIRTMAYLPVQAHVWALSVFVDYKECFEQFSTYTFPSRYRWWPAWFTKALSDCLAWPLTRLMRDMEVVPVYRSQRDILKTMNKSMEYLLQGESLIIFPDIAYSSESAEVGDLYMGYLHLGRSYYRKTGKPLKFVPMYAPYHDAVLDVGEPLFLDPEKSYNEEKERVTAAIQNFFLDAARRDGDL